MKVIAELGESQPWSLDCAGIGELQNGNSYREETQVYGLG
jgi:hypothetical protein